MQPRSWPWLRKVTNAPRGSSSAGDGLGNSLICETPQTALSTACLASRSRSVLSSSVSGGILFALFILAARDYHQLAGRLVPEACLHFSPEIPEVLRARNHCEDYNGPQQQHPREKR